MIMAIYLKYEWCSQEIICYEISPQAWNILSLSTLNKVNTQTYFTYTHTEQ
jgi:hypothetical protein